MGPRCSRINIISTYDINITLQAVIPCSGPVCGSCMNDALYRLSVHSHRRPAMAMHQITPVPPVQYYQKRRGPHPTHLVHIRLGAGAAHTHNTCRPKAKGGPAI